jgi:hypothetical protein
MIYATLDEFILAMRGEWSCRDVQTACARFNVSPQRFRAALVRLGKITPAMAELYATTDDRIHDIREEIARWRK